VDVVGGGEILLGGEQVDFGSTAEAKHAGIAVIYQEPTLVLGLSVTANIFMGATGRHRPPARPPADGRDLSRGLRRSALPRGR
jgi:ABC-type sugar transport system ATPase subunit